MQKRIKHTEYLRSGLRKKGSPERKLQLAAPEIQNL